MLCAACHRVDAPDLTASGVDTCPLRDRPTFEDNTRPLLDLLRTLSAGERAVLVGHSFDPMNVTLATKALPEKVVDAVFVTAFMPDRTNPYSHIIEHVHRFSTTCGLSS
ncbi:salicylic acid-binding protein 2-like [Phragmites australis]|uniref:salicylic acid-binding protein 2-like n=1 Tax=Phragmites australis TaxID=29695 RepID=UPI002D7786FF|nr:salicylic acid-binding protein 2-like [Phragmites australis]